MQKHKINFVLEDNVGGECACSLGGMPTARWPMHWRKNPLTYDESVRRRFEESPKRHLTLFLVKWPLCTGEGDLFTYDAPVRGRFEESPRHHLTLFLVRWPLCTGEETSSPTTNLCGDDSVRSQGDT